VLDHTHAAKFAFFTNYNTEKHSFAYQFIKLTPNLVSILQSPQYKDKYIGDTID